MGLVGVWGFGTFFTVGHVQSRLSSGRKRC